MPPKIEGAIDTGKITEHIVQYVLSENPFEYPHYRVKTILDDIIAGCNAVNVLNPGAVWG